MKPDFKTTKFFILDQPDIFDSGPFKITQFKK